MKYYFNKERVLTKEIVRKFIERDRAENARKAKLLNYYKGQHAILDRAYDDPTKPNNKVVAPYAKYITTLIVGYFIGEPVEYTSTDEAALERIKEIFLYNDESAVNKEIAKNQSICGEAYEILYIDQDGNIRFKALPSLGMIPIYNDDLEEELLYVIRYWTSYDIEKNAEVNFIEVYSAFDITKYKDNGAEYQQIDQKYHTFGQIPVNVYYNNEEGQGDFEAVISEIDAYDAFESDSVNEADYFADSYLMLAGMEGTTSEDVEDMKTNRVMVLPEGGTASWLIKDINDEWIEHEKERLDKDIHKFSFCPPMTDEDFASNASGVAMKYKLLGLETAVGFKESEFEKGLRRRIELIYAYEKMVNDAEYLDINIVFTRDLPQDLDSAVQTVKLLDGVISDETRLALLPLDIDIPAELEKVDEQKQSNYSLFGATFTGELNGEEH